MYHPMVYIFPDGQRFNYDQTIGMNMIKLGTTVVVAIVSWHVIEKPILRLKDRFAYHRSDKVGTPEES